MKTMGHDDKPSTSGPIAGLRRLTEGLSRSVTVPEAAEAVLRPTIEVMVASAGMIFQRPPDEARLELVRAIGYPPEAAERFAAISLDDPVPGAEAFRTGAPVFVESPAALADRYPALADRVTPTRSAAFACLPLGPGAVPRGLLVLSFAEPRRFDEADRSALEALADLAALALERARLHEAERRRTAELRASEARFAAIVASAMDAIITIDADQRIVLFNGAAEQMFRCSAVEALGSPIDRFIPERFRAAHAGHVRRFGETGATNRRMGALGTIWGLRADGEEFPIEATISKVDAHGQRLYSVILRDVTERVRQQRELEDAARSKDAFLAMLGHELRNPLAAIHGALQIHAAAAESPELTARARAIIDRQVAQMNRLLDDLLDISRIGRGKLRLQKSPLDLVELLTGIIEDERARAEQRGLELRSQMPERPIWVEGDRARLVQVIDNLVTNALKFTEPPGRVDVVLEAREARATIRVRDTGVGIDPAHLPHIFEPFRQLDRSLDRAAGGLGLGLAVVHGLVEMHGGTVTARSEGPGRGSEFSVTLPLRRPPASAGARRSRASGAPRRRVLVVDDNRDAADLLRQLLALGGHEARAAYDGREALAIARDFRPDAVLCDIGLPAGMDGFDVARVMRADPTLRGALLVAVTGYGRDEDRESALAAGFDAHLTKPVELAEIEALLSGAARPA